MERLKKDFVVNVSHELRTPLTAIKDLQKHLPTWWRSPTRNTWKPLSATPIDSPTLFRTCFSFPTLKEKKSLDVETVDFMRLVEQTNAIFEQRLTAKGLALTVAIDDNLPAIEADPFKVEQMIINLLDNALKILEKGSIELSAASDGEFLRIQIRDTGIGIPKSEIPRLFERFYVVDKSRSRKSGGTGLGLSIVKHIVALHKGSIDGKGLGPRHNRHRAPAGGRTGVRMTG